MRQTLGPAADQGARILLKADASALGDRWTDAQIAQALDTSIDTVARTRQQFVEQGLEAVLIHKHSPNSARPRTFDGAAEAKLIAPARRRRRAMRAGLCACWKRRSWR